MLKALFKLLWPQEPPPPQMWAVEMKHAVILNCDHTLAAYYASRGYKVRPMTDQEIAEEAER